MKKVLILNPYIPTLGGGEKAMGYFCRFLEEYYNGDIWIDILVFNYNDIDVSSENYVTINDLNSRFGLSLKKTHIRKLKNTDYLPDSLDEKIEEISRQYDLFVNSMIFSKHIGKSRRNFYLCMFPPTTYLSSTKGTFIDRVKAILKDRRFAKSYDVFMANSYYTKSWVERYWGLTGEKVTVIYPPVFSEREIENRYSENQKKNIIVSVGRFFVSAHSKKQLEMVKMFIANKEMLGNYEYHLVGAVSNYSEDIEYLDTIKKVAGESNNVFIHENCPYNELLDIYRQAKVFWHATGLDTDEDKEPEKMEHFGITTVEAMSFGVVPVVINKGGQKEIVEEGKTGFLWLTEGECVQKTYKLIQSDNMRREIATAAVRRSKDFSTEQFNIENRRVLDEIQI